MKHALLVSTLLLIFSGHLVAQKILGDWYGRLRVTDAQTLNLAFHFKQDDSQLTGTWDSPDQGAFGQEITTISLSGDSVNFSIERISASYQGSFTASDSITGTFKQMGQQFPLNLTKRKPNDWPGTTKKQVAAYPNEKAVTLTMRDGSSLYGLLLAPDRSAPLVIVVAGSGPTDMNQNGPALKTNGYLMLAHALDSAGIGSFRYDKRGIGQSSKAMVSEQDLRFENYVNDLVDIIHHFKQEGYHHIFIAGHSEGSLLALLAAGQTRVEGVISIAGAGFPIGQVLAQQIGKQPLPPALKDQAKSILDSLEMGHEVHDVPQILESMFRKSVQPYLISWFQYDPRKEIQKLNCPVLILQGTCDIQVPVEDATNLFNAAKHAQIEIIKNMSHVLKDSGPDCKNGMKGYYDPAIPLAPGLVEQISAFVKHQKAT